MPLFSWLKKSSSRNDMEVDKDDKMQLTLKVLQSQQTDEPVFDISGCNTHYVPDQTYTYCKLLKKTKLLLQNNILTSLEEGGDIKDLVTIQILNLHNNKFTSLPNGIGQMKNLCHLDVSDNSLKSLPTSVGNLKTLREINLNNNNFSKVPACICALKKLRNLSMLGNKVKGIPKEFYKLQSSLLLLELEAEYLNTAFREVYAEGGLEGVMRQSCSNAGVLYVGVEEDSDGTDEDEVDSSANNRKLEEENIAITNAMENYMTKKREMRETQLMIEKEKEERDIDELSKAFKKNSEDKKQMFSELNQSGTDMIDYEAKRQKQQELQSSIEKQMRELQDVELEAYLLNSSGKDNMLENMASLQSKLDEEIEGVMTMKDGDRKHLLIDLHEGEKSALAVMQEIIGASVNKNAAFVALLEEQDEQLQELVNNANNAAGAATEVRKTEVLSAMQQMLSEAVLLEGQAKQGGQKQGWISSLIEDSCHSQLHIQDIMTSQASNKEDLVNMLLHDEECQAAAFKLLLLNNDLKRSNILRQINQVSQELARLSSLELRKKLLSMQYGSTTMLDQRKTLVGLLKSLLSKKSSRESELEGMLSHLEDINSGAKEATDYWLIQYQKLMEVKPAGLAEAEEQLETDVLAVLESARALEIVPTFARYEITFAKLLEMTADNFDEIGIGLATYNTIQRALQHHLASIKLKGEEERSPSAPPEEYDECGAAAASTSPPSAPPSLEIEHSELEEVERVPSAPPTGLLFLESECVICLEDSAGIVLLPCGHVCVCQACCVKVSLCPMCRGSVVDKIPLECSRTVQ